MQEYLETGNLSTETISRSISERNIFPCFFSSALKLDGIDEFIDILEKYTCEKAYGSNFGARIFKISEDEQGNRLTHLKVTGGNLRVKTTINYNFNGNLIEEKINQIRIYSGKKYQTAESVDSGTVCAVTGLTKTYSGEGLGTETDSESPLLEPVLSFAYYSLSSILITQFKEPSLGLQLATELGTIALLANIFREMMALLGAPLIRKYFGKLAPISAAGVNSMDVLLPSITLYSGKEMIPLAIFHGILIDMSVPVFVSFFCSL